MCFDVFYYHWDTEIKPTGFVLLTPSKKTHNTVLLWIIWNIKIDCRYPFPYS